jgi:hypothetical protein
VASAESGERVAVPDAVQRLATGGAEAYLGPHHLQAAAWLMQLFARANLRQRVTMSYDPARRGRQSGGGQGDLAASAADARQTLAKLARVLPPDCWNMLMDACLHDRGLQEIEAERKWPRRSAKLVLRIGLDQLAAWLGLNPHALGGGRTQVRAWLPERLPMFETPGN